MGVGLRLARLRVRARGRKTVSAPFSGELLVWGLLAWGSRPLCVCVAVFVRLCLCGCVWLCVCVAVGGCGVPLSRVCSPGVCLLAWGLLAWGWGPLCVCVAVAVSVCVCVAVCAANR